jgi:hypothetical protein
VRALIVGSVIGLLGAALGIVAFVQDRDLLGAIATVLGVVGVGLAGGSWKGWASACAAVGVLLILLAVYLPSLGAEATVNALFGESKAGPADQADAVALARWVLVVAGVGLMWWGRELVVEAALLLVAVLVLFGAAGVIAQLGHRLWTKDETEPAKASATRSFGIPSSKVQTVAAELAADSCVKIVLVRATDTDTADEGNALTYDQHAYTARLPAKLKEGKPASTAIVELAEKDQSPEAFATDLTASKAAYLLACKA